MAKIHLYYNTLRHVKPTQFYHQVYYRLKNRFFIKDYSAKPEEVVGFVMQPGISYSNSYLGGRRFSFLNLDKAFNEFDWNFNAYGKLWTYNLNYFEFLNQEKISSEDGLSLIQNYISQKENLKDGLEPYTISLRGINWTKFLSNNGIRDPEIDEFLFQDYLRLIDSLEYHLLANHLLENAFSLLFGAYYFQDERIYAKAKKLLLEELKEQILEDGAHYELSPMYHQIILHRVLDSYNLVKNNSWKDQELLTLLKKKAQVMLGWLESISFGSGEIPKLNDAADGIAPKTAQIVEYATKLGLQVHRNKLNDSGYRKFEKGDLEVLMDIGQIAPEYQPGHSHADSLQFVLRYKNLPVIVDTGISTYEKNERRQMERSTSAHNTVTINDQNSSEVWGGFRVARRAKVKVLKDTPSEIVAQHDGYRKFGVIHERRFFIEGDSFQAVDEIISSSHESNEAKGHLHFHPDLSVELKGNSVVISNGLNIIISGAEDIVIHKYQFAEGYNKLRQGQKIEYSFTNNVNLRIEG